MSSSDINVLFAKVVDATPGVLLLELGDVLHNGRSFAFAVHDGGYGLEQRDLLLTLTEGRITYLLSIVDLVASAIENICDHEDHGTDDHTAQREG